MWLPVTGILVNWIPSAVVATMMSPDSNPIAINSPLGWMATASTRLTNCILHKSCSVDQQQIWLVELAVKNWSFVGWTDKLSVPVKEASPAAPSIAFSNLSSREGSPFKTWSYEVPMNSSGSWDSKNLAQQMCWMDPWESDTLNVFQLVC